MFWGGVNPLKDMIAGALSTSRMRSLRSEDVESKIVKLAHTKILTFLILSWSHIVFKAFNETNFPFINLLTSEICQEINCL